MNERPRPRISRRTFLEMSAKIAVVTVGAAISAAIPSSSSSSPRPTVSAGGPEDCNSDYNNRLRAQGHTVDCVNGNPVVHPPGWQGQVSSPSYSVEPSQGGTIYSSNTPQPGCDVPSARGSQFDGRVSDGAYVEGYGQCGADCRNGTLVERTCPAPAPRGPVSTALARPTPPAYLNTNIPNCDDKPELRHCEYGQWVNACGQKVTSILPKIWGWLAPNSPVGQCLSQGK